MQPPPTLNATDRTLAPQTLPIRLSSAASVNNSGLPHVLLIIDQLPKAFGGGERVAMKIAGLLPCYGFRASILTFSIHPECAEVDIARCPVYLLPLNRTYNLQALRAAFALRHFLWEEKVAVVQTFFESSDLWAGAVVKATSDAKLIWSRRDMGILRSRKHEIAYRLMAKLPDSVFAVSEQVRRYCIEVDGVAPDRVETIYNGLDINQWLLDRNRGMSRVARKVVTVGNIRRVKGHDLMVRAAARIVEHDPTVTFSIAGSVLEPDYFEELQSLVRELGLSNRFHFEGPVSNLHEYLSSADIFVLPSRSEGFSNAIIEAMAAGLPVVATDVGGNREAVEDGVNGIIVPPGDVSVLAHSIMDLLKDQARSFAMGNSGRARVSERFSTRSMMLQISATYKRLLAKASGAMQS